MDIPIRIREPALDTSNNALKFDAQVFTQLTTLPQLLHLSPNERDAVVRGCFENRIEAALQKRFA
jgi:hypothetical protein